MSQVKEAPWVERALPVDRRNEPSWQAASPRRMNLAQVAWLRGVLQSRWPQFIVRTIALAGFLFVILTGILGSPVGSHNFAIIIVWIAWWTRSSLGSSLSAAGHGAAYVPSHCREIGFSRAGSCRM